MPPLHFFVLLLPDSFNMQKLIGRWNPNQAVGMSQLQPQPQLKQQTATPRRAAKDLHLRVKPAQTLSAPPSVVW
jgi:hypothetical protein